jgi:Pentapeptide repeats (8 copies)
MRQQLPPSGPPSRKFLWIAEAILISGLAILVAATGPQNLFWPAVSVVILIGFLGLLLVLLGPFARYLVGESAPITARERKRLSVKDRVDALNNVRANILQSLTGLVVVAGLIFTGLGLGYTARTLDTTQQGQITDRYTKAIDQLGSKKSDIRLGGIYALQRIAADSPRDQPVIMRVLMAYVQEHVQDPPPATFISTSRSLPVPLDIDVNAALVVIGERNRHIDLYFDENLDFADLHHRDLYGINLSEASLGFADLRRTGLFKENLTGAFLEEAHLRGADLREAHLEGADVHDADLRGADLYGADLTGTSLIGADLRGADLRQVTGVIQSEIVKEAKTDEGTKF